MTLWFAGQDVPIVSAVFASKLEACSVTCHVAAGGRKATESWRHLMGLELPLRIERSWDTTTRLQAVLESWDTDGRLEFKCRYREEVA